MTFRAKTRTSQVNHTDAYRRITLLQNSAEAFYPSQVNHTETPNRRRATSGNNAPETKPLPVEPGEGRHDGIVYTQRRRRGRTSLMGRLLQAKRFVRILTKSTLSTPAPPPPAVCLAACDPRPVTSRYREPPYPTDAGGGHRPTPGRHQVCTCTFAGNIRLPQPAPGRHRTGSPGGPRPVTAGFLRKSGVDPPHLHARGGDANAFGEFSKSIPHTRTREEAISTLFTEFCEMSYTHTRTREEALLQNSAKVHFGTPHLHARGGDLVAI